MIIIEDKDLGFRIQIQSPNLNLHLYFYCRFRLLDWPPIIHSSMAAFPTASSHPSPSTIFSLAAALHISPKPIKSQP